MISPGALSALLGVDAPILLAPMAGAADATLAIAAAAGGALGAIPCALLTPEQIRKEVSAFRAACRGPINLNFFCHTPPAPDPARHERWRVRLAPYAHEFGIDLAATRMAPARTPFDEARCAVIEELAPEVVSFHFGLPAPGLLARVRNTGARVLSSATNVAEALWLEARGCDAIIAQGAEAGGHRAMFLSDDVAGQVGLFALVPQIVDAVRMPVIAAGAIADERGVAAAFALGASGVQVGTAFLKCPEARVSLLHARALMESSDAATAITNVFTGRPARGFATRLVRELGPLSGDAPAFPEAGAALAALRIAAEAQGRADFSAHWSGQAAALAHPRPATDLARALAAATPR